MLLTKKTASSLTATYHEAARPMLRLVRFILALEPPDRLPALSIVIHT